MVENDALKRYIDAGLAFTAMTQARAEALVKDLVKVGEVQADQARDTVAELLERSRKNSEKLLDTVRTEVRAQITNIGLASHADLDRFERRISSLLSMDRAPAPRSTGTTKKTVTKKTAAKKKSAKKSPKKTAAKRSPKKTVTTKQSAKKA